MVEYNKAMNSFVKRVHWQEALAMLPELRQNSLEASVVTYNTAISACVGGAHWELAMSFLHQLQHERLANVITFSTALSSLEVSSLWAEAVVLLTSMGDLGVGRNSITYSAAISACAKGCSIVSRNCVCQRPCPA